VLWEEDSPERLAIFKVRARFEGEFIEVLGIGGW
jgi:hypothetical protein